MPFLDDQAGLTSSDITRLVPTGALLPYTGAGVPGGYLLPDGSAVLRADYPDLDTLYSSQGYPFGNGDGVTTFNLPDLRSRSLMMIGQGTGLSLRTMGQSTGEENHVLSEAELASHTHTQNAHTHTTVDHNHTQNAHTHTVTDPGHNHTQDAHTHTQDAHTHTQNSHDHALNGAGDNQCLYQRGASGAFGATGAGTQWDRINTGNPVTGTTATNQNTTATNQNATATNQSNTTGMTNQNATATNIAANVTVNDATAVNNDAGSDTGHNTVHPVLCVNFILKY